MKWIVRSALLFAIPMYAAAGGKQPCPGQEPEPDLFKKNDQICSFHAEFLYWTVAEGALDYALTMKQPAWGTTPSYAQGNFETANFDMDPGVRVSFLYFRAPHYWEVKWQYTRIGFNGDDKVSKPVADQEFITGTWPHILTAPLATATSHIHLNYNLFDMSVDRVFIPNPHLRLRVIAGAEMAWINQDWKVRYSDSAANCTTIRNKWDFIGGGLKSGTMVDWYWNSYNIYMTAQGSFGLLIGSYSNDAKQTTSVQPTAADNPAIPIRNASYQDTRPVFTAQMLFGPSWQKNYPKNRVELFAGFEMNMWFNLQEVYRSTASVASAAKETWMNTGLLSLYGLTTRLTVDF
jgi:hypothetical protein